MIYYVQEVINLNKFIFNSDISAKADPKLNNPTTKSLWNGFCLKKHNISFSEGEANTFSIGDVQPPVLPEGKEFAIHVTANGAAVTGCDYGGLVRGFCALLMKIECKKDCFMIPEMYEESHYTIKNRMIHICIFPENDLYFIKKLIRLSGLCQYTHIVIEFWGMLKYDCLAELSWPNAFTKDEARELIREARELGMEPIPMFNQLGHATASRVLLGKHVTLDQNPALQYLFTPDGWAWDIESEEVFELLKKVRFELYELFGEGEYMHIGCDEAYYYTYHEDLHAELPDYLRRLTNEVASEGKRPMVWMDMLLERGIYANCTATCAPGEVELLQKSLHPSTVMVDWQYNTSETPIPTAMSLKDSGHDVMGAPWYEPANYTAWANTIIDNNFFGIMMTTWHTLSEKMPSVLGCAKLCGITSFPWGSPTRHREETAAMMRRVSFEGNTYEDCGWSKMQIKI